MKLFLYCGVALIVATLLAASIGYGPTQERWGDEGLRSMLAVAGICLCTAVLALIPMALIAPKWPQHIGQAVLAGTVIRLLLTMMGCVGYQIIAQPQLGSFLFWATIFYLLLLTIETGFGVAAIRRYYRVKPTNKEGAVL